MSAASPKIPPTTRAEERREFLARTGWGDATAVRLTADASTRRYERLDLAGRRALLMDAPPAAESAACPAEATSEERQRLGYNALARLAGPNLNAYLAVAEAARSAGLSVPGIYAADPSTGFALIEDLGDDLYSRAIPQGAPEEELYRSAIDALSALRRAAPIASKSASYQMLTYDKTAMEAEVSLLADWYWPYVTGGAASDDAKAEYRAAWAPVLAKLPAPSTMALRDYHADNLLWLPRRDGFRRAGVIDFQDALVGNAAYDLVSLLEDARRDVSPDLAEKMIRRYLAGAAGLPGFDEAAFRRDYAILGAQRNAKILGIFARLIMRDKKPRYADFLPRVEAHFRNNLRHAELEPVARFVRRRFGDRF